MNDEGAKTTKGMLLSMDEVIYIVSFYQTPKAQESPEILIKRLMQKEVMIE